MGSENELILKILSTIITAEKTRLLVGDLALYKFDIASQRSLVANDIQFAATTVRQYKVETYKTTTGGKLVIMKTWHEISSALHTLASAEDVDTCTPSASERDGRRWKMIARLRPGMNGTAGDHVTTVLSSAAPRLQR